MARIVNLTAQPRPHLQRVSAKDEVHRGASRPFLWSFQHMMQHKCNGLERETGGTGSVISVIAALACLVTLEGTVVLVRVDDRGGLWWFTMGKDCGFRNMFLPCSLSSGSQPRLRKAVWKAWIWFIIPPKSVITPILQEGTHCRKWSSVLFGFVWRLLCASNRWRQDFSKIVHFENVSCRWFGEIFSVITNFAGSLVKTWTRTNKPNSTKLTK